MFSGFLSVFKLDYYCWLTRDVRAAMLVVKKKSISLLWELNSIFMFILLHEKFLIFDWLRAVVFQLNLKYLHVKITNLVRVVV